MPSELERKIQTVILAAPTTINAAEDLKNCSAAVIKEIEEINKARRDTKQTAISTAPLSAAELMKALQNPANKDVLDPVWKETVTKLSANADPDALFKLTYMFMRHKLNTIPSEPLIRGANLAACKALFKIFLEKSMQESTDPLDLDSVPPEIPEKVQALMQLMYKRHLEMGTNMPEAAVAVEIYFCLYSADKKPTEALISAISEQLKNPLEVNLSTAPTLSSSSQADLKGANPATLFRPSANIAPPPLAARTNLKIEAEEEINAIIFQERLTAFKSTLSEANHSKNKVAQELLTLCNDLDKNFKSLIKCHKELNYLPLKDNLMLKGISINLELAPEQKEKNSLFILNTGISLLAQQLDKGLGNAIQKEAKKGSGLLGFMAQDPDPRLLKFLSGDKERQSKTEEILRDRDQIGKLTRPTLH